MGKSLLVGALGLVLFGPTVFASEAEDPMAAELYGQGLHAFFARDYQGAITLFDSALGRGAQDPRDYYFRGLAYLRTGCPNEATTDFQKGAQLEAASDRWVCAVGESLSRIQGKDRLEIERYRQPVWFPCRACWGNFPTESPLRGGSGGGGT